METAVSAGRIERNASDSDSAVSLEMGSVKDKIGRFTDNPHAVRPINHSGKDWKDGTHPPTTHDPLEHSSQKPTVPRKPVMLASTKPPEPIGIPTKPLTGQAESQKRPPFINELMGNHPGVRPAAPDHSGDRRSPSPHPSTSSNKPSPPSIQPRPKLPPRIGTSSDEQSSTSASSKRSLPLHIDRKPRLPPRRDTPPISRTNTDQRIIMQDNESPRNPLRSDMGTPSTRSLNENTSSLLDEPSIMVEPGPPKPAATWPVASDREPPPARKVPPPPPRQRRAGPQGEQKISPPRNTAPNHLETKRKITPPEQTRYETVWAANKGLYIPSPTDPFYSEYPADASEMVLNLVVRDIWSRSCLPSDVLQRIWDLVDRQNVRLLTREEFVVGMWLIDRVLEGRRLPGEVPGSVWGSLRSSSKVELL